MFPTLVTNLWKERIFVIDIKYIFMKVPPYTWLCTGQVWKMMMICGE